MQRPKADSFTTFLEAQERLKSSAASAAPVTGVTPLTLLFKLAEAPEARMPVTELMAASGIAFTDFAEALKNLKESGYLTLSGPPSNEIATLTKLGEDFARLARSK
jgi:predicted transcriptional regulator